jgi:hypothetical protein
MNGAVACLLISRHLAVSSIALAMRSLSQYLAHTTIITAVIMMAWMAVCHAQQCQPLYPQYARVSSEMCTSFLSDLVSFNLSVIIYFIWCVLFDIL